MNEIKVPDFSTIRDFAMWAERLNDKDIQTWKTNDWLKMYEKLDATPRRPNSIDDGYLKDLLVKLYRNYRLDLSDFKSMLEIGKEIGENFAQKDVMFDVAAANINNEMLEGARMQFAEAADRSVYDASQYSQTETPLAHYGTARSTIEITEDYETDQLAGTREQDKFSSLIRISNATDLDCFMTTAIHESVHAHLQTLRESQQDILGALEISPNNRLSKDFYRLLQYNDKYYVKETDDSTYLTDLLIKHDNGEITDKELKALKKTQVTNGYARQPLETEAELIGKVAEHYYRQKKGHFSERTGTALAHFLGVPKLARYNHDGYVQLSYLLQNRETFDKDLQTYLDEETRAKLTVCYDEKNRRYDISVRQDFKAKDIITYATGAKKFAQLLGITPTGVDYEHPDKIILKYSCEDKNKIRGIFENTEVMKFTPKTLAKIEIKETTDGGCTVAFPKDIDESKDVFIEINKFSYQQKQSKKKNDNFTYQMMERCGKVK